MSYQYYSSDVYRAGRVIRASTVYEVRLMEIKELEEAINECYESPPDPFSRRVLEAARNWLLVMKMPRDHVLEHEPCCDGWNVHWGIESGRPKGETELCDTPEAALKCVLEGKK